MSMRCTHRVGERDHNLGGLLVQTTVPGSYHATRFCSVKPAVEFKDLGSGRIASDIPQRLSRVQAILEISI